MGRQQQRRKQRQRQSQRVRQNRGAAPPPAAAQKKSAGGRPWLGVAAGIVAVVIVVGVVAGRTLINSGASPTPAPQVGSAVDGVQCATTEQTLYHIHQYVELYDHGTRVHLPTEIGIPVAQPGNEFTAICLYWLHVHASEADIIHVESPLRKIFTFGQFLDVWKATYQTATPSSDAFVLHLEQASPGQVHVFVNGKTWTRGYGSIPLTSHAVIAVDVGNPVIPWKPFTGWNGL